MLKRLTAAALVTASLAVSLAQAGADLAGCKFNGIELWGNVEVVDSFPDIKVQIVSSFPDLNVKRVTSFPDQCGLWKIVTSFPDFTIKFVTSFPDFRIEYVDSFPGLE